MEITKRMKAKTKFLKMFFKLPKEARTELVIDYSFSPKTLHVVAEEIRHDTELGKKLLTLLGYK